LKQLNEHCTLAQLREILLSGLKLFSEVRSKKVWVHTFFAPWISHQWAPRLGIIMTRISRVHDYAPCVIIEASWAQSTGAEG